jgi:hypothetical protein
MFQACAVNTSNTEASSAPITLPGNRLRKKARVKVAKLITGTDCRMSSAGISTISARRLF